MTYLKYAFADGPIAPNDDAWPLSGTVPPIRICVGVIPGGALVGPLPAAGTARPSAARTTRAARFTSRSAS
ncbi:MAG: hypothetical protein E6G15_04715 [Actinobacteria bacterium]|nr:MAG: hypothetical protein E6G15_04715 [Actinomycetota bacterium]